MSMVVKRLLFDTRRSPRYTSTCVGTIGASCSLPYRLAAAVHVQIGKRIFTLPQDRSSSLRSRTPFKNTHVVTALENRIFRIKRFQTEFTVFVKTEYYRTNTRLERIRSGRNVLSVLSVLLVHT